MVTQIDADTPRGVVPLAWLLGLWAGVGVIGYPDSEDVQFGQEVLFEHRGRDFLHYTSQMWALDADGKKTTPLDAESGYWRVVLPDDLEAAAKKAAGVDVEVMLAHPTGIVEVFLGRSSNGRIDLATDVVARTATSADYSAAKRMYGLVEGDLLWALDIAARGHSMTSYASARLKKVTG